MRIYDITQELFGGNVYPGDLTPTYNRVLKISNGDPCNLTTLQMCVHNGTHVDAPYHFYDEGKTIEGMDLERCVGPCTVIDITEYDRNQLEDFLKNNKRKRLLLKGNQVVTLEIAKLLNQYEILLVGVEGQSVGPFEAPMPVHLELLEKDVVLLEGIVLKEVPCGNYFLFAAPLKLGGSDGAPCRAILLEDVEK